MKKSFFQNYVEARLAVGGCALTLAGIFFGIVLVIMGVQSGVEYIRENWGTEWPLWLMIILLVLTVVAAVLVHSKSKIHEARNAGIALAFGAFAFTFSTILVLIHKGIIYGALFLILTLVMWWVAVSYLLPKKKKGDDTTSNET